MTRTTFRYAVFVAVAASALLGLAAGCRVKSILPREPMELFAERNDLLELLVQKTEKLLALVSIKHTPSISEFVPPQERETFDAEAFVVDVFGVPTRDLELHYFSFVRKANFDEDASTVDVPVQVHMRDVRQERGRQNRRIIIRWRKVDGEWFVGS